MAFLYQHFSQLIFYDLNIHNCSFSTDGSHEFIKTYPDPEKKIVLIEKTNLSDIKHYKGVSFVNKRKMFAVGSSYVRNNIDVFWCPDMDEFFDISLMQKVEDVFTTQKHVKSINTPHLIFVKNLEHVYRTKNGWPYFSARIARHKPGTIYGHCGWKIDPCCKLSWPYVIYHYSYIGDKKLTKKMAMYERFRKKNKKTPLNPQWMQHFLEAKTSEEIQSLGHPARPMNITQLTVKHPPYIDVDKMVKDLAESE